MARPFLHAIGRSLVVAAGALLGLVGSTWAMTPDVRPLAHAAPPLTAYMRLRADEARAAGRPVRRVQRWVPYDRISPNLKRAVLVAEDDAFWQHDGLDYGEIRASLADAFQKGERLRGASTITQQLAKNLYLSPSRNPYRKLEELFITRRLEAVLGKRRIFELYLNEIEWGDGIWGCEAAAQADFGESAADLTPEQAALLAGAIINPRRYNPAHPNARLLRRQALILSRISAGQDK